MKVYCIPYTYESRERNVELWLKPGIHLCASPYWDAPSRLRLDWLGSPMQKCIDEHESMLPDVRMYPYMYGFFECIRIRVRIFLEIIRIFWTKIRTFAIFWEFNLISDKTFYYVEKCFKQKLCKIKFPTKNGMRISISTRNGASNICHF